MIILTKDNLLSILQRHPAPQKVMVMIGSEFCQYCAAIKPFFETMATIYADVDFYYLDSSAVKSFDKTYDFEAIPALFAFRNGNLIEKREGGSIDNITVLLDILE